MGIRYMLVVHPHRIWSVGRGLFPQILLNKQEHQYFIQHTTTQTVTTWHQPKWRKPLARSCKTQHSAPAGSQPQMGLLNTPNEPAHNPSGASSQALGSKLTEGCEQGVFETCVSRAYLKAYMALLPSEIIVKIINVHKACVGDVVEIVNAYAISTVKAPRECIVRQVMIGQAIRAV